MFDSGVLESQSLLRIMVESSDSLNEDTAPSTTVLEGELLWIEEMIWIFEDECFQVMMSVIEVNQQLQCVCVMPLELAVVKAYSEAETAKWKSQQMMARETFAMFNVVCCPILGARCVSVVFEHFEFESSDGCHG